MAETRIAALKPVYLIFGKEDLLLERALRRLRDMVLEAGGGQELDFDTFEGPSASGDDIVAAANTMPFLSERRMVIVRDVDRMPVDQHPPLVAYAENPAPFSVLVLVASSLAKNTRLYKTLERVGAVSEFAAPRNAELPGWVISLFKSMDRQLPRDAAEVLVRAVGKDLRRLQSEADKIVAYAGERKSLTREDVEAVVAETAAPSIFEFLDAMGSRDCETALKLLAGLMAAGESINGVHAMAVRHVRSLMSLTALRERGTPEKDLATELRMAPWQIRTIARQAAGFSDEELIAALKAAAEAEARMKTSQGDPRLVFERWLLATCGGRARR